VRNENGKKLPFFGNELFLKELDVRDRPWGGSHQGSEFMSGFGGTAIVALQYEAGRIGTNDP
jgi:hypothetical protein